MGRTGKTRQGQWKGGKGIGKGDKKGRMQLTKNGIPDNVVNKPMRKSTNQVKVTEKVAALSNATVGEKRRGDPVSTAPKHMAKSAKMVAMSNVRAAKVQKFDKPKAKGEGQQPSTSGLATAAAKFVEEDDTEFEIEVEARLWSFSVIMIVSRETVVRLKLQPIQMNRILTLRKCSQVMKKVRLRLKQLNSLPTTMP